MHDLTEARKQIEIIDQKLIELIAQRMRLCEEMGAFKKENGLAIVDKTREAELQTLHANWATQNALSPIFITALFEFIFEEARRVQ